MDYLRHTLRLNALALLSNRYELLNSLTHGLGFALSLAGAGVMTASVWQAQDAWRTFGCCLFVATMVAVYGASTLSHMAQTRRLKRLFRVWDQALIYLLIVGTFTPFALVYLRTNWVWCALLGVMWTLALGGFISKIVYNHKVDRISIWLYLILGWLPILTVGSLIQAMPAPGLWWIIQGGIAYTLGTVFLMHDHRQFFFHAIWHVLVLLGSLCHFMGVFYYVATHAV
jgi:hemolysin III